MPDLLLVDDNAAIAQALSVRFRSIGIDVRHACDGEQALKKVSEKTPDAMLLDIRMPGIDGIEVCRRLKAPPDPSTFPVVFLSAETSDYTREQAMEAGGAAYFSKPYQANELIQAVESIISRSEPQ